MTNIGLPTLAEKRIRNNQKLTFLSSIFPKMVPLVLVFLGLFPQNIFGQQTGRRQEAGGVYGQNSTLFFRNSPFMVSRDMVVEAGVTLTIETGVKIYFKPGVGLKVHGTLYAVGGAYSRIQMLPFQNYKDYETAFPYYRLIDGPSTRQGRLQIFFKDKWRSICTQNTNWTYTDYAVACNSMGFGGGSFWRWFRRNNDTYPFVMPKPGCKTTDRTLKDCTNFSNPSKIPLSENLCQGEDDVGLICWGPPSFSGWQRHWKGVQFINVPYELVEADPNHIALKKQSWSRMEYVDILYAGYDNSTKNSTAGVWVQGTPPFINDIHVIRSARDGIRIIDPDGPVLIANSTIKDNRGHGIVVDNTTDGRVFINETRVEFNYGDGIRYRQKGGTMLSAVVPIQSAYNGKRKRQTSYYEPEKPEVDFCILNTLSQNNYFPRFVQAYQSNGTVITGVQYPCRLTVNLPRNLRYTYTVQFVEVVNKNPTDTRSQLVICDGDPTSLDICLNERYRIPILDGMLPQSVAVPHNNERPLWIGLNHTGGVHGQILGTVDIKLRIHATVKDRMLYGLNITNSRIVRNWGRGVLAQDVRDRTVITNTSISDNQYIGLQVLNGAGDVWINASRLDRNFNDGVNVSYVGGSIYVNGTTLSSNRMRGAAFHHNDTSPFIAVVQQITFQGRPSNYRNYLRTVVEKNGWGGVLVGNFCANALNPIANPRVTVNYVEFIGNEYHPAFEYHSCQRQTPQPKTHVEITGSRCEQGTGFCIRVEPAVNMKLDIDNNQFLNNSRSVLLIRNRDHQQLRHLPAEVKISNQNQFKFNKGPFIVSVGLNEDAPYQFLTFDNQNELRENTVFNPYPHLNARNRPYAAMIVSSSNVKLRGNCFRNRMAEYEIATDLPEHAKIIDAKENNWGSANYNEFVQKIFDQFYRFSLASIDVSTYAIVCNSQDPQIRTANYDQLRKFSGAGKYELGGEIYEHTDLLQGTYTVVHDLHILPGAKLTMSPRTKLQFQDSIGMLVQGQLTRTDYSSDFTEQITFTKTAFMYPQISNIRLVDSDGKTATTSGRLEVMIDNRWGTICNRSWTVDLAKKACNQLGLFLDPEFIENWRIYPEPGDLPIIMDIIRCEEMEWDLTNCRHDGVDKNLNASCRREEVVGIRCMEPRWAGVRYSLLANPPITTRQAEMHHWTIEQAGLFDYSLPEFSAALQIDWNYHAFNDLVIKDNFWNGLDIVYNDLTRKPQIWTSKFMRNRRNGIRIRSVGVTISGVEIFDNENAGLRYNPIISHRLQQDVVTWLDRLNVGGQISNNVIIIPKSTVTRLPDLAQSSLSSRRFLVAKPTPDCPLSPVRQCSFVMTISASNNEGGLYAFIGVQIVNRPHNDTDEDVIFESGAQQYSARKDTIHFPFVTQGANLKMTYKRSYGDPGIVVLLFFMDSGQYLDRFVHVDRSNITNNQYAISTLHYSNFTHWDGSHINRWEQEKLWFQKINFTQNKQAVLWVNGPLRDVYSQSPIAEITYHIDNCSVIDNNGSIIETHRDLHSSANVFKWKIWSSTFGMNDQGGISVTLPDTYDLLSEKQHEFNVTESRFQYNKNFQFELAGYFAKVNISSNNFTNNHARADSGLMILRGMEKELVMERNRWELNQGTWILKYDIQSQTIQRYSRSQDRVPARIRYNYWTGNYHHLLPTDLIVSYPRSYALALLGLQKVVVNYNRFDNVLLDFEVVVGLRGSKVTDVTDVAFNWWGVVSPAGVLQRVFDFDDWNIYSVAKINPYYTNQERFINWQWKPEDGQTTNIQRNMSPSKQDLKGRLFESMTLERVRQKWPEFPYYYKPDRPYRITKDLTIMPGVTLTIEKGVEIHLYPNVRILVLGNLRAEGTFYEPIRFKPLNVTELKEVSDFDAPLRRKRGSFSPERFEAADLRERRDIIYREFPLLRRQDSFYQKFDVFLVGIGDVKNRSGFLEIYNATTGDMVPICDRQFTRRNAEVVCRELGYETRNVYSWVRPRWDYDPKIRIVKSYSEPRQCIGTEKQLSDCDLRLNGDRDMWYCTDSEHFVFIHCGDRTNLNKNYVGHWGGIVFTALNLQKHDKSKENASVLRNVEIVGAGFAHNDSSVALELIYQTPILDAVNVTNSSMHGIQILAPRNRVELKNLNVTDNHGLGLNILGLNLQSSDSPSGAQIRNMSIPYNLYGILDMCSVGREVFVESRLLVYYKYDSYPVDCVKYFITNSPVRHVGFRLLQGNLYNAWDPAGRPDAIRFYQDKLFSRHNLIAEFRNNTQEDIGRVVQSGTQILGVHLRANAADGRFGFVAEVASLPAAPDRAPVNMVTITNSRFLNNDRGAIHYSTAGELSPTLIVDSCYIGKNGKHIWGNFSTSESAVDLNLHNTQRMRFVNNMVWKNQGGLQVQVQSTSSVSRLSGLIKNSIFAQNDNFETLRVVGKHFQEMAIINNYFGKNRVRYHDVVFVNRMTANFTHNVFYNNTGTHIVDMTGYLEYSQKDHQTFYNNFLFDNIALGHGYQFPERYGYLPELRKRWISRRKRSVSLQYLIRRFKRDNYRSHLANRRLKRDNYRSHLANRRLRRQQSQLGRYKGTSFEWWANIGDDTDRYRSTILAGNSKQVYQRNFFSNPINDYELTTTRKTEYDTSDAPLNAQYNFWGFPGTDGVAQGKIRDQQDYSYLVAVQYKPVLQSNTSILEGSCPGGWFQAGIEEYKSCFLYVPGVMTHEHAEQFCEEQGAFMPYFRKGDKRLKDVAERVDYMNKLYIQDLEKYSPYPQSTDSWLWVSGVQIPVHKCGYLSSATGDIRTYNCEMLLPFVCEQGRMAYQDLPFLFRGSGIAVVIAAAILLILLIALIAGWWHKSRQRKEQHLERKNSLRASIRSNKMAQERIKEEQRMKEFERQRGVVPPRPPSPDIIASAHKNMVLGRSTESLSSLKKKAESTSSLSTTVTDTTSSYPMKKGSPTYTNTESAYRSDYSPGNDSFYSSATRTESTKFNFSGAPSGRNERADRESVTTPSLSSFRGGSKPSKVVYRKDPAKPGKGNGRRHDTTTSEATTCSTCPTESVVSYDQSGTEYSRESRGTSYTGSTVTEPSTARSSGNLTETDTVNDEGSSVYGKQPKQSDLLASPARRRTPVYHSGSDSFLDEDDKDYLQGHLSPVNIHGYTPQVPPRPVPTPSRPARGPPLVPNHQNSVPNMMYPDSSQSQDSLMDLTSRMDPTRSMGNLDSAASGNNWRPPNLNSFSRASTATQGYTNGVSGKAKPSRYQNIPLETAM